DRGHQIADVVDAAALPRRALEGLADRGAQPLMGDRDDQAHTAQPAGLERPQERAPERLGFGVADVDAEYLPATLGAHPGGHYHRPADHLAEGVVAHVNVDRVQIHVRELAVAERAVAERR